MLLRRLARPLLASSFVYDGVQAALHPAEHASGAREGSGLVTAQLGRPALSDAQVSLLVRAHGIATALAGVALAVGRAPRTAALVLAALTAPLAVVNQPFTSQGEERTQKTTKFMHNLGAIGAALIAGVDLEGRPGISWRVHHAREAAAVSASKAALKASAKAGQAGAKGSKAALEAGAKAGATVATVKAVKAAKAAKTAKQDKAAQKANAKADKAAHKASAKAEKAQAKAARKASGKAEKAVADSSR